jgi:hypothetical protein
MHRIKSAKDAHVHNAHVANQQKNAACACTCVGIPLDLLLGFLHVDLLHVREAIGNKSTCMCSTDHSSFLCSIRRCNINGVPIN